MPDIELVRELVKNPREALNIEVKAWIDPTTPEGHAKIARCLLAMRNHGGGFLVIGFDDKSLLPATVNRPTDVRATFHADTIQAIVSRYASESFEVVVHFPERDGFDFPVIEVPLGVRTPVAAKNDLRDGAGQLLIRRDTVFIRSLDANGTASTTSAGWKDWPHIVEICFDNREADVGRFLRRHLSALSGEHLKALISAAAEAAAPPPPTLAEHLAVILDNGLSRFDVIRSQRRLTLPAYGWWEIAALVRGAPPIERADLRFRDALLSSNPNLTGWPAWVDSRHFSTEFQPRLADDLTWEAFINNVGEPGGALDFWRLSTKAEFYLYRAYEDDVSGHRGSPKPMTVLDFGLPVWRVAEAFVVGQAFASALGAPADSGSVAFAFRWNALKDRELSAWAQPGRMMLPGRKSYRDVVVSVVELPIDTPRSALHTFVDTTTQPLFEAFAGLRLDPAIIEDLVKQLFTRR